MFDIFYQGTAPELGLNEQQADNIEAAQSRSKTRFFWWVHYLADLDGWDWLWEPPPWQAHQRHAWPDQHQPDSGIYLVPAQGFSDTNYHTDRSIHRLADQCHWLIPEWIDPNSVDRRWSPDPDSPPYQYEFPVEWGWKNVGGPIYQVPGATERKFASDFVARTMADGHMEILDDIAPDDPVRRWRPNPADPPYVYVFGNQWWPAEKRVSAEYHVPGATERKYIPAPRTQRLADRTNFKVLVDSDFDWSWEPDPGDPAYIYVFGNRWWSAEKMPTVEYHVPGATERKFMSEPRAILPATAADHWHVLEACTWDATWCPDPGDPPYIYVFGNQWWPAETWPTLEYRVPGATEQKYVEHPRAQLPINDSGWWIPAGIDPDSVDRSWRPDPGSPPYIYEFGTQHQKTGGPEYHVPGAVERKYVDQVRVEVRQSRARAIIIDHMDDNARAVHEQILRSVSVVKTVRYVHSYHDTLQRIAQQVEDEWVWIVSSVCDYQGFDFTWYPEQWQATMLHVFASDDLKFGDTFFMHVPTFRERAARAKLLEWYDVNFVEQSVPRRPVPVVQHQNDTHVDTIRGHVTQAPVTLFTTASTPSSIPAVNLWRAEVKTVTPLDTGASQVLVPREAISAIRTQVYDYAYIDKTHRGNTESGPMDIVFISNGEANADQNWGALLLSKQGSANRCVRVDGINGRAAAYHAAAEVSETAWFFAVFAKLQVLDNFDWSWQPDRLQQPKHYIFHALNPVNQLEYGHQAMIAYNRKLTLANPGRGLDFTLDDAHEVVPILSGVARYNVDAWTAWRTAFREVIKLRASLPDVESEYRIQQWVSVGNGPYGQHSRDGAQDALDYYDEVNGDFVELRKSYEWAWLASYALVRRNLVPDPR